MACADEQVSGGFDSDAALVGPSLADGAAGSRSEGSDKEVEALLPDSPGTWRNKVSMSLSKASVCWVADSQSGADAKFFSN